jgi:hypothetical protein
VERTGPQRTLSVECRAGPPFTTTLDRMTARQSAALQIGAILVVGAWVVLWTNWWSLISAVVLLVSLMIYWALTDYRKLRGLTTKPMPRAAKWFVILFLAHSVIGLFAAIYKHAV